MWWLSRAMRIDSTESALKLVAQVDCEQHDEPSSGVGKSDNYFRSVDWSPDGTCLITNSADNSIRTFIVPPELLDEHDHPLRLEPYSAIRLRESADAIACHPAYNLEDVSTTLILSAVNEHPIRLNSALTGDLIASYPLVNPNTEAYIKPQSMMFTDDGSYFITGSQNLISTFDVSRPGSAPLTSIKTGPKKSNGSWSNPTLSLRGLVSALAVDRQYNVLAAGTFSRQIGLYDAAGQGECVGVFSIAGTEADKTIFGNGVTGLAWSDCGRYLYINERKSDGVLIYDIRQSGQLLSWVCGRAAMTNQRMKVDLTFDVNSGTRSIWAGGQDGKLRRWIDAHLHQGSIEPLEALQVHKGAHTTSSIFVATNENRYRA